MDEADKYKQRLEAIAEKRRLQEEQDKAKRDMEDEKLRQQQLKRKSLRDKWLMEGPPLSPTSPNSQSPLSPSADTQAQDMEKHTDKFSSENELMAEEKETQMEDDQQEAVKAAELEAEITQETLQNGENKATRSGASDDEEKVDQSPPEVQATAVLTNGEEGLEANGSGSTPEQSKSNTNGPVTAAEIRLKLQSERDVTESGQVPRDGINEEEEEGTLVMRAECVIITDEGDEAPEEFTSQEDQQESLQSDQAFLPNPDAGKEIKEAVDEEVKAEDAPETLTEMEKSEAAEVVTEAQRASDNEDVEGGIKPSNGADGETTAEGQDEKTKDPNSAQQQSPEDALEGTTVALVPVCAEVPPPSGSPRTEAEATATSEGAEAELRVEEPTRLPGQFQEVPLTDPADQRRAEPRPGEQQPLLQKAEASNTKAESAGANSPEAQSPPRAGPGGASESTKHKTCQCCSVM